MKFGLPGSAGSVPTVLHDATDTGTDYIFGGGEGCQNDTQGLQNPRKLTKPGWFDDSFSLNFALPGQHFGGAQGCQNDAQGT